MSAELVTYGPVGILVASFQHVRATTINAFTPTGEGIVRGIHLSQQEQSIAAAPASSTVQATAPAVPQASGAQAASPASAQGTLARLAIPLFAVIVAFGFVALATLRW